MELYSALTPLLNMERHMSGPKSPANTTHAVLRFSWTTANRPVLGRVLSDLCWLRFQINKIVSGILFAEIIFSSASFFMFFFVVALFKFYNRFAKLRSHFFLTFFECWSSVSWNFEILCWRKVTRSTLGLFSLFEVFSKTKDTPPNVLYHCMPSGDSFCTKRSKKREFLL